MNKCGLGEIAEVLRCSVKHHTERAFWHERLDKALDRIARAEQDSPPALIGTREMPLAGKWTKAAK